MGRRLAARAFVLAHGESATPALSSPLQSSTPRTIVSVPITPKHINKDRTPSTTLSTSSHHIRHRAAVCLCPRSELANQTAPGPRPLHRRPVHMHLGLPVGDVAQMSRWRRPRGHRAARKRFSPLLRPPVSAPISYAFSIDASVRLSRSIFLPGKDCVRIMARPRRARCGDPSFKTGSPLHRCAVPRGPCEVTKRDWTRRSRQRL